MLLFPAGEVINELTGWIGADKLRAMFLRIVLCITARGRDAMAVRISSVHCGSSKHFLLTLVRIRERVVPGLLAAKHQRLARVSRTLDQPRHWYASLVVMHLPHWKANSDASVLVGIDVTVVRAVLEYGQVRF